MILQLFLYIYCMFRGHIASDKKIQRILNCRFNGWISARCIRCTFPILLDREEYEDKIVYLRIWDFDDAMKENNKFNKVRV